jgi:hypothetical protein
VEPPLQTIYLPKMNRKNSDYYSRPQWFTASDEQNIFETHKWVFNQCKPIFHHKSKSLYMSWIEYSRTTLKTVLIYSFTPSKNHHRLGMPASWVCPTPAAPWATWRDARGSWTPNWRTAAWRWSAAQFGVDVGYVWCRGEAYGSLGGYHGYHRVNWVNQQQMEVTLGWILIDHGDNSTMNILNRYIKHGWEITALQ